MVKIIIPLVVPELTGVKEATLPVPEVGKDDTPPGVVAVQRNTVPAADELKVTVRVATPEHTTWLAILALPAGSGIIVTVVLPVSVHPVAVTVPVTIYVVAEVGEALTTAPVVALNPAAGVQT